MKSKKVAKPIIKHVPMRTCIATGNKLPKNDLIRLVRTSQGLIKVDPRSKLEGRGANLTMTIDAFDLAVKKRAIFRALKLEKQLTQEEVKVLRKEFEEAISEKIFRPKDKPVTIRVKKEDLKKSEVKL